MPNRIMAERTVASYVDHSREYFGVPPSGTVTHQFSSLYFARLSELRSQVEVAACARWGKEVLSSRVKTLDAEPGAPVLVIGTIYKEMQGKPSIMDEMSRDVLKVMQGTHEDKGDGKYCGDDDTIMIEDESGRLALRLPAALAEEALVTGAVVGVAGTLNDQGELLVEDICAPGLPKQVPRAPPHEGVGAPGDRFIALVSGLRVGHPQQDMLPLQLLTEHLTGHLGCDEDHRLQAKVVRLVVAGNSTSSAAANDAGAAATAPLDAVKKLTAQEQHTMSQHVRTLDQFLTSASAAIPVDLMPGTFSGKPNSEPAGPLAVC